jgi:hypothetical protein
MANLKTALRSAFEDGTSYGTVNSNGYLYSFLDNVYDNKMSVEHQQMFDHGSGGELHSKAEAVHSSSMLGYNFFSWIDKKHPFVWDDVVYTKVYFEVQLRTLCCRSNPANMDIVLEGERFGQRVLLFIESKFLEYTNHGKLELSEAYLMPKNYYMGSWNDVAYELRVETRSTNHYNEGLKQSFCHLVALNALQNPKALAWFNANNVLQIENLDEVEIRFTNAIFYPRNDFEAEYQKYQDYEELYRWFKKFIARIAPYSVQPGWNNYYELWRLMRDQISDINRKAFLERRYINFAEKC